MQLRGASSSRWRSTVSVVRAAKYCDSSLTVYDAARRGDDEKAPSCSSTSRGMRSGAGRNSGGYLGLAGTERGDAAGLPTGHGRSISASACCRRPSSSAMRACSLHDRGW